MAAGSELRLDALRSRDKERGLCAVADRAVPELVKMAVDPEYRGRGIGRLLTLEAIDRAGAEALGRDIDHGLERLADVLS